VEGAELDLAFVLALFERFRTEQLGEGVVVAVALLDPRSGHGREVRRAVGLSDFDEAGPLEQLDVRQMGRDADGSVSMSPPTLACRESWRRMNGDERRPPAWAEEASGCSQHGELGPQSTQHIGVHDGVERRRLERQGPSARRHDGDPVADGFGSGPGEGVAQPLDGYVTEHGGAAGPNRQVQARPSTAGAQIEQPNSRCESEGIPERLGLRHRRVPVGAPIAADDDPLDLLDDLGAFLAVTVAEPLPGVAFFMGDHVISVRAYAEDWVRGPAA
jgi:hypothetical protein